METTDPYEQQLLAVFQSCDDYYQNSLSCDGLYQLCEKLQLEDHYHKLLKCVLGESENRRVTFFEFKDGLLKLLNNSEFEDSSDRAASPDDADDLHYGVYSCSTYNENGSEESVPKKRKTGSFKRKDHGDLETKVQQSVLNPVSCTLNEEECLTSAWISVSRGITTSLKKDKLVNVFQCVGLESGSDEAAQKVFEKLEVDENGSITLQELLQFIRSGAECSKDMKNQEAEAETCRKRTSFENVDSSAMGSITGAYLVEQWEAAGVPGASHFLHKLGLSEAQQIDVASLIALLSDKLVLINEDKTRSNLDPSTVILLAITVLQNIHVQNLKSHIEHMNAEKDKLRNDVLEANQRALLLAQEIDDHHSKLEHSAQLQVKTLEQRHMEKIRELTLQLKSEQEAQATHTSQLEKKVLTLEEERNKCKAMILQLELENKALEQEHQTITDQLSILQRIKEKLEADLQDLSNLQMKATEKQAKANDSEIMSLMERINILESENTNLRDRNDELSTEVEELSMKLHNAYIKKRSSPINSSSFGADESMDEGSFPSSGTKRRGDSFGGMDSAEDSGDEEGSPRLGKVRKCSPVKDFTSAANCLKGLQIHAVDRGEILEDDSPVRIPTSILPEEVRYDGGRTRRNISFSQELQQVLDATIQPSASEDKMKLLEQRLMRIGGNQSKELVSHVKDVVSALSGKVTVCEGCSASAKKLQECEEQLAKSKIEMEEKTKSLGERCKNLETSLELMREEYEKTEDYWAEKLEEERTFFEEEQKVSDKKYAELIDKIIEYEEMLGTEREQRQRLETIDEKDGFEKQVMDLEQECLELRSQFTNTLKEKDTEIERLKEEIKLASASGDLQDASVQVEVLNAEVSEVKKFGYEPTKKSKMSSRRSSTFSPGDRKSRRSSCQVSASTELRPFQDSKKELEREIEALAKERDQMFKEIMDKRRDLNTYVFNGDSISNKFIEMEDKCHSLMTTLRHQQKRTEEILKNSWKQHKTEVGHLKSVLKMTEEKLKRQTEVIQEQFNKLARTDLIVKELFVENAFLVSSVQKLEKQCHTRKADDCTV